MPRAFAVPIKTNAMSEAKVAYSIEVAPLSSWIKAIARV
jgi:hypothetical protein